MATLKERYQLLVRRLYQQTSAGNLTWKVEGGEAYCSLSNYEVFLRESRDSDGEPLEIVDLKNTFNEIIDTFNDLTVSGQVSGFVGIDNYYQLMAALRLAARRNALGADKALDLIIEDLGDDNFL